MAHSTQSTNPTRGSPRGFETRPRERLSDPKLRAQTERILAMPVADRLRQLEEEANFFLSVRPLDD
jgi:hypothetical protein